MFFVISSSVVAGTGEKEPPNRINSNPKSSFSSSRRVTERQTDGRKNALFIRVQSTISKHGSLLLFIFARVRAIIRRFEHTRTVHTSISVRVMKKKKKLYRCVNLVYYHHYPYIHIRAFVCLSVCLSACRRHYACCFRLVLMNKQGKMILLNYLNASFISETTNE